MEQQTDFQAKLGGSDLLKMLFYDRRKSPRRSAKDGVLSIDGVHVNAATTRLLDISGEGFAFKHISPMPLEKMMLDINLLVFDPKSGKDLFFHRLKAEILSIADIHGSWGRRGGSARRYGMRFVDLSLPQQYSLAQFLEDAGTVNVGWKEEETATH